MSVMLREAGVDTLNVARGVFPGLQLQMVVDSILEGNTTGRLWVLDPGDFERLALLWDQGNNVFYLSGDDGSDAATAALASTVENEIRPSAVEIQAPFFSARAFSPGSLDALKRAYSPFLKGSKTKRFYEYTQLAAPEVDGPRLPGIKFVPIGRAFLGDGGPENARAVESEIRWMWPSVERYLKDGWGTAAVMAGGHFDAGQADGEETGASEARSHPVRPTAVCWCTAEYVGPRHCGIGIETIERAQRRGVATAAASRFIAQCLARGRTPHWECSADNIASVRVAEKLGFELVESPSVLVGRFS